MSETYDAKIVAFLIQFAQRGTTIEAELSIPTRQQCTNEHVSVRFQYPTKNLFLVLWRFRRDAKAHGRSLQEKPGDHDLSPSDFTKGLLWT